MRTRRLRSTVTAYTLLAPSLFGVAVFLLLPMFLVAWLSLHRWDLLGAIRYAGLDNWRGVLTDGTFGTSVRDGHAAALPEPPTLANYTALADAGFGRAAVVTALMTAVIVVGQLTFSVLGAYAFARLTFPGRDTLSGSTSRR